MYDLSSTTHKITDSGGVTANKVVVQGTNAYECKLPTAANAGSILGVTAEAQSTQNKQVRVQTAGVARITAADAISVGDPVNIHGTTGKVKTVNEATGTLVNVVGQALTAASADGDVIEVALNFDKYQVS